ncbi:hypothetical protein ASG67_15565 [Sphingomonas sp. Leaf339]|nr:hypothetical protein ASG67_15565 [Sphingomonas sp. Leaf339]
MLCLGTTVLYQFIGQIDAFGNMTPQDGPCAFERLGHGSHPQLAIIDIDQNGITCPDSKFTTHQGWYYQFAALDDLDPLRFHSRKLHTLTCLRIRYHFLF